MCTNIVESTRIDGSAKGANGWFALGEAHVSYDHPFHAALEHALNIDFVNAAAGPGARVAVELTRGSAERLIAAIRAALDRGVEHDAPVLSEASA
jgi:Family of unknown function (DUF6295)